MYENTVDFNGDNRTDVGLIRQDRGWGTLPVAFSDTDGSFTVTNEPIGNFATFATSSGVEVLTGDFNGDNRTDVGLLRQDRGWGTLPVAFSDTDG
ncbi:FG-GAP repeat domain-containing protein, partial [Dapis sp. BLCC M229]|uniref:FG-GAP repeat domain-containing protein n=1 Tax=Dapis sp. BLCC M229 TaxID=3400188 RepID=UPI003CE8F66C